MDWKNRKTHWYKAVSSALNFPFLKEVLQNSFVLDVLNFEKMRKSRRIASFRMLSNSKSEDVSQNCFVLALLCSNIKEVSQNFFVFDVADR